jgi:hypothetical protein
MNYANLQKFDGNLLLNNSSYLVIGNTSKDFTIKDILHNIKDISSGMAISDHNTYDEIFSITNQEFTTSLLNNIKSRQLKMLRKDNKNNKFMLVIDTSNNKSLYDKEEKELCNETCIQHILYEYKCYNITMLYTLSDCIDINISDYFTFVFILGEKDYNKRLALFKSYETIFKDYSKFTEIMDSLKIHEVLLIHDKKLYIKSTYLRPTAKLF